MGTALWSRLLWGRVLVGGAPDVRERVDGARQYARCGLQAGTLDSGPESGRQCSRLTGSGVPRCR